MLDASVREEHGRDRGVDRPDALPHHQVQLVMGHLTGLQQLGDRAFLASARTFAAEGLIAAQPERILVLGAAYTLWMIKRVIYGEVANDNVAELSDLNRREFIVLGVLAIAVLLIGVWPAPLIDMMNVTIEHLIEQIGHSKL